MVARRRAEPIIRFDAFVAVNILTPCLVFAPAFDSDLKVEVSKARGWSAVMLTAVMLTAVMLTAVMLTAGLSAAALTAGLSGAGLGATALTC
jgi:hypothetical protein